MAVTAIYTYACSGELKLCYRRQKRHTNRNVSSSYDEDKCHTEKDRKGAPNPVNVVFIIDLFPR